MPKDWLAKKENWPEPQLYQEWVAGGERDVHVDRFEWKSAKNPAGVDRVAEWGPMGGTLSSAMLPCEKPIIECVQDESIFRTHDQQKKCWREEGQARSIAPKGEGAGLMLSGFCCEVEGGFPVLTVGDVERYNQTMLASGGTPLDPNGPTLKPLISKIEKGRVVQTPGATKASELFTAPSLQQLQIGKNNEGYWTSEHQVAQVKAVDTIMKIKYPWCQVRRLRGRGRG